MRDTHTRDLLIFLFIAHALCVRPNDTEIASFICTFFYAMLTIS